MSERRSHRSPDTAGRPPLVGRRGPSWMHMFGEKQRAKDVRGSLLRIWKYLSRDTGALVLTAFLVVVASLLSLLGPYLIGVAIDRYILNGDLFGLARTALTMIGCYVASSLATWLQVYVMSGVSLRAIRHIRRDLFAKLQTLSLRFFDRRTHGELMSRLTNDVENINMVLTESVTQLISSTLSMAGIAVMMFLINVRLAIVTLLTIPMTVGLSQLIARQTRQGFRDRQQALGDLNGLIEETITGQRVVKAYVREQAVIEQFRKVNLRLRRASTRAQILAGSLGPLNNLISAPLFPSP